MEKSKLEIFITENNLRCEIELVAGVAYCAIYKREDENIKFFNSKYLSSAIEQSINHFRRISGDKISK